MVALSGVTQGKKETLHAYIDRFTEVDVVVKEIDESLKCWIFQRGLLLDNIFWEKLVRKEAYGLNELLSRLHSYVKYEEKLLVDWEIKLVWNLSSSRTFDLFVFEQEYPLYSN